MRHRFPGPALLPCLLLLWLLLPLPARAEPAVAPLTADAFAAMLAKEPRAVVTVMAAWCGPCRRELPLMVRMHRAYAASGLRLIGLSVDFGGPGSIAPTLQEFGVDFPVYWVGEAAIERFGLVPIPMTLFVADGKVTDRIAGLAREDELERKIKDFLR